MILDVIEQGQGAVSVGIFLPEVLDELSPDPASVLQEGLELGQTAWTSAVHIIIVSFSFH